MPRNRLDPKTTLRMRYSWFISQNIGSRSEQQDSAEVMTSSDGNFLLAVLADGAGGHRGGRIASKQVIEVARKLFEQHNGRFPEPQEQLRQICCEAHVAINRLSDNPRSAPRSTIAALYIAETAASWIHVGDSRIYRSSTNRIAERSKDHTMAQILFEQGEIMDEEIGRHPDRIKLLRALGGEEMSKPSLGTASVCAGDTFLLCSDGCWETSHARKIEEFFGQAVSQGLLDWLVKDAVSSNGSSSDNVSACAVEFS